MAQGSHKRILWLSRHSPEGRVAELRRIFGQDAEVQWDQRPIAKVGSTDDVLGRMRSGRFDEIVLVAPTSILGELCQRGVHPIWPRMDETRGHFLGFDRICSVRQERQEVEPEPGSHVRVMWLARFYPEGEGQVAGLRRLFGSDVEIIHDRTQNAEQAVANFYRGGYRAMVAVVPETVFERLSEVEDLPLLRSEAIRENDPARIEFRGGGGQGFRFDRYVWYRVKVEAERL